MSEITPPQTPAPAATPATATIPAATPATPATPAPAAPEANAPPATLLSEGMDAPTPWGNLPAEVQGVVGRFKNVDELAKGYVESQKHLSQKGALQKPTTPEGWAETLTQLGMPQDIEGYDLKAMAAAQGATAETQAHVKNMAHKVGLLPPQAEALMRTLHEDHKQAQAALREDIAQKRQVGEQTLRHDWGEEYQKKLNTAQRAIEYVDKRSGAEVGTLRKVLDGSGLGDNPDIIRAFAAVGEALADAPVHGVAGSASAFSLDSPEGALRKLNALQKDPEFQKRFTAGDPQAIEERQRLYEQAYDKK